MYLEPHQERDGSTSPHVGIKDFQVHIGENIETAYINIELLRSSIKTYLTNHVPVPAYELLI